MDLAGSHFARLRVGPLRPPVVAARCLQIDLSGLVLPYEPRDGPERGYLLQQYLYRRVCMLPFKYIRPAGAS